jgi:hypothetical protein
MSLTEDEIELFVPNRVGRRMLGVGRDKYRALARAGKITVVGRNKGSRSYLPSVRAYLAELLAEAGGKA